MRRPFYSPSFTPLQGCAALSTSHLHGLTQALKTLTSGSQLVSDNPHPPLHHLESHDQATSSQDIMQALVSSQVVRSLSFVWQTCLWLSYPWLLAVCSNGPVLHSARVVPNHGTRPSKSIYGSLRGLNSTLAHLIPLSPIRHVKLSALYWLRLNPVCFGARHLTVAGETRRRRFTSRIVCICSGHTFLLFVLSRPWKALARTGPSSLSPTISIVSM